MACRKKKLNQELSIMEVFRRNVWNLCVCGLYWARKERNVVVVVLQLRAMN